MQHLWTNKPDMWQDPIAAETRALRDEYARQFNYDAAAIFQDLVEKQAKHPERMISFPARKPALQVEFEKASLSEAGS